MCQMKYLTSICFCISLFSCKPKPEACFEFSKDEINVWESATTVNCSSNSNSYHWEYNGRGAGTDDINGSLNLDFDEIGSHDVTLTAFSRKKNNGKSSSLTKSITVKGVEITEIIVIDSFGVLQLDCPSQFMGNLFLSINLIDPSYDSSLSNDFTKTDQYTYVHKVSSPVNVDSKQIYLSTEGMINNSGDCVYFSYSDYLDTPNNNGILYQYYTSENIYVGFKFENVY